MADSTAAARAPERLAEVAAAGVRGPCWLMPDHLPALAAIPADGPDAAPPRLAALAVAEHLGALEAIVTAQEGETG